MESTFNPLSCPSCQATAPDLRIEQDQIECSKHPLVVLHKITIITCTKCGNKNTNLPPVIGFCPSCAMDRDRQPPSLLDPFGHPFDHPFDQPLSPLNPRFNPRPFNPLTPLVPPTLPGIFPPPTGPHFKPPMGIGPDNTGDNPAIPGKFPEMDGKPSN